MESFKFDFSKPEDQRKFDKLPPVEKQWIINDAQKEALEMNAVFDAEKIQERELSQAINGRIEELLKQGMPLRDMAEMLGMNAGDFVETIGRDSQSRSAVTRFDAEKFTGQAIAEIKRKNIALPEEYVFHEQTITPPGAGEISIANGEGGFRKPEIIPRTAYIMELLGRLDYSYRIHGGQNTPKMMRELSYRGFETVITETGKIKLILACNEEGNATFVAHEVSGMADIENILNLTKEQLNARGDVSRIEYRFENPEEYKVAIKMELEKQQIEKIKEALVQTGNTKERRQFLPFEEAREKARDFGFEGIADYRDRYKEIPGLPGSPDQIYKNKGWINWADFLGTVREHQKPEQIFPFEEARERARNFNFESQKDYNSRYKEVPGLPSKPNRTYKNKGWINWADFLGTVREHKKPEQILPFEEARKKARDFGFKGIADYRDRYKEIPDLPFGPSYTYKNKGWINWADFLGTKK